MPLAAVSRESSTSGCAIKVLDLLTNRYHLGKVRSAGRDSLVVEMPPASPLRAAQRIRFVLADDAGVIVSRKAMRSAVVAHVEPFSKNHLLLIRLCGEPAAA